MRTARPSLGVPNTPIAFVIDRSTRRDECPKKGTELFVENKFGVCYFGFADIRGDALRKSSEPVIRIDCRSSSLFAIRQALFRLAVYAPTRRSLAGTRETRCTVLLHRQSEDK